ncbi:hypothetical protein [Nocardia sp. NBC_01327]|uniref:hypothetical protein n=1 Tax=Nocardia sp. NBC_01327 TaxID=2903593 RepID=UPI002E0E2D26|nr:hypothetical protein OG326_17270 [Nocardia sp. NBC_01327]
MPIELSPHVSAASRLTAHWCTAADADDFVVSGCGVWPLSALAVHRTIGTAVGAGWVAQPVRDN